MNARHNSVPSPFNRACHSTLFNYTGSNVLPSIASLLGLPSIREALLPRSIRALLQICFLYNCRISEVLSIVNTHVIDPDRVLCIGSKRSYSYIIYLPELSAQLRTFSCSAAVFPVFPFTYTKAYRWCTRIGLSVPVRRSSRSQVLHSSRHYIAHELSKRFPVNVAGDALRHRSATSISYYL